MSSFTDPLIVKKLKNMIWVVEREFYYFVGSEDSKESIRVPNGFITDFASVPRPFWIIFPPDGQYTQAAVLHDYLYYFHLYDRKKSDYIFLEAMKVLEVSWWKRRVMYRAVRMFGGLVWDKRPSRQKELKKIHDKNSKN